MLTHEDFVRYCSILKRIQVQIGLQIPKGRLESLKKIS